MQFIFIIRLFTSCSSAIEDWHLKTHILKCSVKELNEQIAAIRSHFQYKYTQCSALWIQATPVPPRLSSGKCYVELEALKSSSLYLKGILANSSVKSFCIMTQLISEQLKELPQAIGSM